MSSSTSSSSVELPAPRRLYVRTLLVILLGMGAALVVVNVVGYFFDASAESILARPTQAIRALPSIVAEDRDLVISFGSSMTEAGFSPRQFDREMEQRGIEVRSFNFGFGGLNPYFQDYLSRRMRDAFVEGDRRLALALIEFTPLQNTKARWRGAQASVDSYVAMLGNGEDIWEIVKQDPTRGVRMAEIKYLRNEVSAEITTWYFGTEWFGDGSRPDAGIPPDEEKREQRNELIPSINEAFEQDYPDYDGCDWCPDWQGGGTIPEERSPELRETLARYYELGRTEQRLADDRLWRITCCDIEQLDFEEELIAAFIRTVENFKSFSDRVEVILMPRNHAWIGRPPEAERRLADVLERIRRETGVNVRSFEETERITAEMFSDTTHLTRYDGDVAYTSLLVDTYAPLLGP